MPNFYTGFPIKPSSRKPQECSKVPTPKLFETHRCPAHPTLSFCPEQSEQPDGKVGGSSDPAVFYQVRESEGSISNAERVYGGIDSLTAAKSPSLACFMQRTSTMTLGFVLIFVGIQLAIVDSYVLTTRVANFLSEEGAIAPAVQTPQLQAQNSYSASPYSQISYQQPAERIAAPTLNQRTLTPPGWLCWPMLFCGTVVFIHGFSKPRD